MAGRMGGAHRVKTTLIGNCHSLGADWDQNRSDDLLRRIALRADRARILIGPHGVDDRFSGVPLPVGRTLYAADRRPIRTTATGADVVSDGNVIGSWGRVSNGF
jgi:hypothetical protein